MAASKKKQPGAGRKVAAKKKAVGKKKAASKKRAAKKKATARGNSGVATREVGRPTKYTDDMPARLVEFFNAESAFEVVGENDEGKAILAPRKFPTLARFAADIGVHRDTLHEWATAKGEDGELLHPDFSDAYKRAKDFQEALLVEGALAGVYHGSFSIFTAKNILGWRDVRDMKHSGTLGITHEQALEELR